MVMVSGWYEGGDGYISTSSSVFRFKQTIVGSTSNKTREQICTFLPFLTSFVPSFLFFTFSFPSIVFSST